MKQLSYHASETNIYLYFVQLQCNKQGLHEWILKAKRLHEITELLSVLRGGCKPHLHVSSTKYNFLSDAC
jgi:hypothetical protein